MSVPAIETNEFFLRTSSVSTAASFAHIIKRLVCSFEPDITSAEAPSGSSSASCSSEYCAGRVPINAVVAAVPRKFIGISSGSQALRVSQVTSSCAASACASAAVLSQRFISAATLRIFSSCIASLPKSCFSISIRPPSRSESPGFSGT